MRPRRSSLAAVVVAGIGGHRSVSFVLLGFYFLVGVSINALLSAGPALAQRARPAPRRASTLGCCQAVPCGRTTAIECKARSGKFWPDNASGPVRVCDRRGRICIPVSAPTPTPRATPVCTPPRCRPGEVFYCPGVCPGGCGTICAIPTPLQLVGPVYGCCQFMVGREIRCECMQEGDCHRQYKWHYHADKVCDRRGKVCVVPTDTPTPTPTQTPTPTPTPTPTRTPTSTATPPPTVCIEIHGKGGAGTEPCENRPNLRCDGTDAGDVWFEASCIPPFTLQECVNKKTGGNGGGDYAHVLSDYEGAGGCICDGWHGEKTGLFSWGEGHWSWCEMDARCCYQQPPPSGSCITVHGKGGAGTEPCENRPDLRCDGTDAGYFQIEAASCFPPYTLQKCLNKKTGGNGEGDWARVLPDYKGAGGCICEGWHKDKALFGAGHWSWCTMDAQCCVP